MTRRGIDIRTDESIAFDVLAILSKKWHPLVIVTLDRHGPMGFSDLLETIPDVSGKVLTRSLEALQDAGVVERTVLSESPLRVKYELTDAGHDMSSVFDVLTEWGEKHLEQTTPTVLLAESDRRITRMYSQWLADRYDVLCAHNDDELEVCLDENPDVVVFEREFPRVDPTTVIDAVSPKCRIIILAGSRPGSDLLDIPCDDVLRKPLIQTAIHEAIDEQLARRGEPDTRRERASLSAKCSLFESVNSQEALKTNTAYIEACSRLEKLQNRSDN
ncbi:winged helix-turn-helix transcriptional regulator [Halomontanus rarus]|uniref:winged helix-turn-helix transcriptional regulator n=1 Tax=Halomontanus rarus TaxID=3034020 RepID=UPI0023E7DC36|nr:winged helix-turn-helix transcriptional regulator [Halovivax sp. TS33]